MKVTKIKVSGPILELLKDLPPLRRWEALNFCIAIVLVENAAELAADDRTPVSVDEFFEQLLDQSQRQIAPGLPGGARLQ